EEEEEEEEDEEEERAVGLGCLRTSTRTNTDTHPASACAGRMRMLTRAVMALFYQQTLAKSASLKGTSLHTGEQVTLALKPAPVDHGIKFKRTDLADEPTIEARIENIRLVEATTTLAEGNVKVNTVE